MSEWVEYWFVATEKNPVFAINQEIKFSWEARILRNYVYLS